MHTFSVWAPDARTVAVQFHSPDGGATGDPVALTRSDAGWWTVDVADAGAGTDYTFVIDDGPGLPDPRSAWQPHGVHGPSRVFDPGAHDWRDAGWRGLDARGRVLYELHLGTFTAAGTLDAAVDRLDHLVDLGVEVVELMPVAAFPGNRGWGYDGVDLYAVHEAYGGPAALQRFVDAAHSRGLAVCLDVVYNHLGPSGNYLASFGPYFTSKHHTPWGSAVNLDDDGSQQVRRFICDNALRWLRDFHVDALRLDAVHELRDDSVPPILTQLAEETAALAAELGRPLTLIAESDLNDAAMVTPVAEGGIGLQAQWDDDFHHALHSMLTRENQGYYLEFGSLQAFAKTMTQVFFHNGTWSAFREQDWGAEVDPEKVGGHRFVVFGSNHDQVGNRAVGDRPAQKLSPGLQAVSAALVLTSPFTPMLFMGEEWGASTPFQFFTDHEEPELARAVREGRRGEFASHGWAAEEVPDPQDRATRDSGVLRWEELASQPHAKLLAWYRSLIALRAREADLRDDDLRRVEVSVDEDARTLVVHRGGLRVLVNLSDQERAFDVTGKELLGWGPVRHTDTGLSLGGESVVVVRVG